MRRAARRIGAAALCVLAAGLAAAAEWQQERFPQMAGASARAVVASASGDILVGGSAAEVASPRQTWNGWVARLAPDGTARWEATFGLHGDQDTIEQLVELPSGDLVAAGTTCSFGPSGCSPWVLRCDGATGRVVWAEVLDSPDLSVVTIEDLVLAQDGRIVLTASAWTAAGRPTAPLIEIDEDGAVLAQRTFAEVLDLRARRTSDGGYFLAGKDRSLDAPWVARIDATGTIQWQLRLSGTDETHDLALLGSEALVLLGVSRTDFVRLDDAGAITWQARLATPGSLEAMDASDGSIRAIGRMSNGAAWLPSFVRIDASGTLVAQASFSDATWQLTDVATTATGAVVAGRRPADVSLPDAALVASLDAAGTLGPGCSLSLPLPTSLDAGGVTAAPSTAATVAAATFVATRVPARAVAVTSCVTTRCSAVSCTDPCAEITAVDGLPACVGSWLTFESAAGGNAPWTQEWDFDYTGTFTVDATGATASASFATPGTHVVALRVTDSCAATGPRTAWAMRDVIVRDCLPAGPTWAEAVGDRAATTFHDAIEHSTGDWVVLGKRQSHAWILRIGRDGEVRWSRALDFGGFGFGLVEVSGGTIAVGVTAAVLGEGPFIVALDPATGDVTSARSFGSSGVTAGDMARMPAGGLAWCGTSGGPLFVVAMSDPATIAWQARVDGDAHGCYLDVADDGSIVTTGGAGTWDVDWAMRHDAAGGLLWQRSFSIPSGFGGTSDVGALPDGGAFLAGRHRITANQFEDAWVARLTPTGSVAWQRTIGGEFFDGASGVTVLPGGDVAVAGQTRLATGTALDYQAWLMVFDGTGAMTLQRAFGDGNSESANVAVLAADGSWLLAGAMTDASPARTSGWLARLNAQARLEGGCDAGLDLDYQPTGGLRTFATTSFATAPSTLVLQPVTVAASAAPPVIRVRCASTLPAVPAAPVLLAMTWTGSQVVLRYTLPPDAEAYSVYEFDGPVVGPTELVQVTCHLGPGHPSFTDLGDGTAETPITPSRDLTSYLVTASNWLGESSLGVGTRGVIDVPPSSWRCGASP